VKLIELGCQRILKLSHQFRARCLNLGSVGQRSGRITRHSERAGIWVSGPESGSGKFQVRIPEEGEQDSGLKANSDSGGKANGLRPSPEWRSRCPECFF
jgi:hypothetical protein